jgi:hypothetical protein
VLVSGENVNGGDSGAPDHRSPINPLCRSR